MERLIKYRKVLNVILLTCLIGVFITNSIFYYDFLSGSNSDYTELYEFGDKESEKEEEKKEEKSDDKIRLFNNYCQNQSLKILAKTQGIVGFETLHHPDILTPPPEFLS